MGTKLKKRLRTIPIAWKGLTLLMLSGTCAKAVPVASFSASPVSGCTPLTVQFNNTSTGASTFFWDMGNGNTSTLQHPSNVYTSPGNYTITLVAFDAFGQRDTFIYTNYITVVGKPSASFTCPVLASCLDNNSFPFANSSTGAVSYLWDFGDGSTSTQANPVHHYQMSGTFTITLIATNAYGCQDIKILNQYITIYPKPHAILGVNMTGSCDPNAVFQFNNSSTGTTNWLWNFGDGTTSTQANPSHVYPASGVYGASLILTNNFGCKDTSDSVTHIRVGVPDWGDFNVLNDSGCAPYTIDFQNLNYNVSSCLWDFGDGGTATTYSPSHTYTQGGSYTVSLIISTFEGCVDTVVRPNAVFIGVKPNVSFTFSTATGCAPITVNFTNTSSNFVSCQWNFGDGTVSTATNPVHTYANGGSFSVSLKCWGPTGCTKGVLYSDIVRVTSTEALFTASPRVGCPPLDVNFLSITQGDSLDFHWDFGDGTTSTQANPSHTYTTSGNFDVTLIVTDTLGCTDTIVKPAYIRTVNPVANYIPPPTTVGCAPLTAQFTDATAGAVSWLWNFGDGSSSTQQNPVHTYSIPGFYTVSLTTTSAGGGCSQTINAFSSFDVRGGYAGFAHTSSPCPPYIATFTDTSFNAVSWLWDFGDGTTSTSQHPTHTYGRPGFHSVSLTITTADGCSYTTMQSNSIFFPPFGANFYGISQDTTFPMHVQFMANSVGATAWYWDFGDTTYSSLENPMHIYPQNGTYNVTLTITNGLCTLFYAPPPFFFGTPDTTPVDQGNPGIPEVQQGCAPLTVTFSKFVLGSITWLWDFGDGTSSTEEFPLHTYPNPGIYSVSLTTTDTLGISTVLQMDSIVRVAGPQAGFIVSQTASCQNTQVVFIDSSKNAIHWEWNFGDGVIDSVQFPSHIYTTGMQNYVVTQTVTDTMGCTSSISTSIYSNYVSPVIASESEICGLDSVEFFTSMQNFAFYHWDFGDSTYSNQPSPSHLYTQEGTFTVTLTVTDVGGCTQTFTLNPSITVNLPAADFTTPSAHQGCDRLNVAFQNLASNATIYYWNFGDGNTSTLPNPVHSYTEAGIYDVSLTIFSGSCESNITYPQYIEVDTAHADFSYTISSICTPVTVQFTDLSANAVSWDWDFGPTDSSSVQNPLYTFTHRLIDPIQLSIIDIHGCTDTVEVAPLLVMVPRFTTDIDSGCIPLTVTFTNQTYFAFSTQWDFGDGTTSNIRTTSHTYTAPGDYDIRLIVTASAANGGCSDTLFLPAYIHVQEPHANFDSPDRYACAPFLVNFNNQSVDGNAFLWDFGDGTTSTNQTPSHIYNNPGLYTVSLIAYSNGECSDTIVKPDYIRVLGPVTNFVASAFEGCAPFNVNFTDLSQNAIHWSWNFGDGYDDVVQHASHLFQDTGTFTVSLVTTDTSGCSSYFELPQKIIVHPIPIASFSTPAVTQCQPYTAIFQNQSSGNTTTLWNFGDGDTSSAINPSHTYLMYGNYYVSLMVSNQYGCSDTSQLAQPLVVTPTPLASFNTSTTEGCPPLTVNFTNASANESGATYFWDFGNGQTSTAANPTVNYTTPGFYTIKFVVSNGTGCADSLIYPAHIHVLDTIPPPISKIFSVSVTSNTTVEITWENNPAIDLLAYVIYRLNPLNNVYSIIHTETNVSNTNFTIDSRYTDTGLNTLQNTYTYKVQTIDICGHSIPLDQLIPHTTINVSSQGAGKNIFVTWTPYDGCPVSGYKLYRSEPGTSMQFLADLSASTFEYLDTTFDCPYPYSYKVIATDLCGNTYTSLSDTSLTYPLNTLANQIVDVVRSTVVDNSYVLTEWKQPTIHPEKIAKFDIYRSTDNYNFHYINSVPSSQTDFLDYDVDVQKEHYYYKILVINSCNIDEDMSTITSTILLQGEMDEMRMVHLQWSPYSGWESGVEYYILEKKDENGQWQLLKKVDGNITQFHYQEY